MKILAIIPARFSSTRFPGKPLVAINGKSMIQRVYEQVLKCKGLAKIVVATDDVRIAEEVTKFGGEFIMTADTHVSGTDRCAEVAGKMPDFDIIINIQGDEPFIDPIQIELVASCFKDASTRLATLVKRVSSNEELFNVNTPKVVLNHRGEALYFSRETIPFIRNVKKENWLASQTFYKHIGIYGYQRETLLAITKLKPSPLELAESLEQLRWLENGFTIQTKETTIESIAIDNPEDLERIPKQ